MKSTQEQFPNASIIVPLSPDELANVIRSNLEAVLDRRASKPQSTHPTNDELYTAKEATELLHVSRKTLREWEKQGRLCPDRIGRRTYYTRSDIDKALKGGQA